LILVINVLVSSPGLEPDEVGVVDDVVSARSVASSNGVDSYDSVVASAPLEKVEPDDPDPEDDSPVSSASSCCFAVARVEAALSTLSTNAVVLRVARVWPLVTAWPILTLTDLTLPETANEGVTLAEEATVPDDSMVWVSEARATVAVCRLLPSLSVAAKAAAPPPATTATPTPAAIIRRRRRVLRRRARSADIGATPSEAAGRAGAVDGVGDARCWR
jgi:hypothetical protein